jgi:hypothetical protein
MMALVSMVMVALPAQAGLADLLDDLLDPVEDVPIVGDIAIPVVEDVVDPIVEDIVDPLAGGLADPIVEEVLAPVIVPIVDEVVTPIVEDVVGPVVDTVVPPVVEPVIEPVVETIPPVETTTTTAPAVLPSGQEAGAGESARFGLSSSGYPGGVVLADSSDDGVVAAVQATTVTTGLQSLEAARVLQTALVDGGSAGASNPVADPMTSVEPVDAGWLDGLTNWLRNSAGGLFDLLAMPIRLLELLARALLTAGSGLIAPLSMLLAFTAMQIKDRRWGRARA